MAEGKQRVIIKRPDEKFGHVTNISFRLENLQKTVEGYIETLKIAETQEGLPVIAIVNEEGLLRGLPYNFTFRGMDIVGTVILCSCKGDNLCGLPPTYGLAEWKFFMQREVEA